MVGCTEQQPTVSDIEKKKVVVQVNGSLCGEAAEGSASLTGDVGDQETNAKKVYAVLHEMGYSNEQVAGVLGNWSVESGIDPSTVETIYDEPYEIGPKKQAAEKDWNNFTLNTVFPAYSGASFSINKQAYKAEDGNYYPGIGLAQFTGPAGLKLINYAQKYRTAWYSFDLQLAFSITKEEGGYGRSKFWEDWLNQKESSADSAAETFLAKYEGVAGMMLSERQTAARDWFEKIKSFEEDSAYAKSIINFSGTSSSSSSSGGSIKSAKVSTTSSGELQGSDVAEQVWNFFKAAGFSDAATAGIMGNLQQESSMDPKCLQNGHGPAAGICQMETYGDYTTRWGTMAKKAEDKGKDWTDLQSQLEFMLEDAPSQFEQFTGDTYTYGNGTVTWWPEKMTIDEFAALDDIELATEIYCRVFERPSVPMMENRINAAKEYYERFKGTGATSRGEMAEECEDVNGNQRYGNAGIGEGDKYHQGQGLHYHSSDMTTEKAQGPDQDKDSGAQNSACGAYSFTMGVNMLLGEVHKFCGAEVWYDLGKSSTTMGSDPSKAENWLKDNQLSDKIELVYQGQISSGDDIAKYLDESCVVVCSAGSGSSEKVFIDNTGVGSAHSSGHYILWYKYEDGKYYANDPGRWGTGAGCAYTKEQLDKWATTGAIHSAIAMKRK